MTFANELSSEYNRIIEQSCIREIHLTNSESRNSTEQRWKNVTDQSICQFCDQFRSFQYILANCMPTTVYLFPTHNSLSDHDIQGTSPILGMFETILE
jgi:hypothetical protein